MIEYHDVLGSTLVAQASEELGGVKVDETSIMFKTQGAGLIAREMFMSISKDHFRYRLDVSTDGGETWNEEIIVVEANRIKD